MENHLIQRLDTRILNKPYAKIGVFVPDDLGNQRTAILVVEQPEAIRNRTSIHEPYPGPPMGNVLELAFRKEMTVQRHELARSQARPLALLTALFCFMFRCGWWHR